MDSSKKIINMARKWRNLTTISRKRITYGGGVKESYDTSPIDKGHFVVYTSDQKRFVFPLCYLNTEIFMELLEMAEEEFGHQNEGPITLPCDSLCLEYVISLIRRGVSNDLKKALLLTITNDRCFSTLNVLEGLNQHHLPICGF